MRAASLLEDRECAAHFAVRLKIPHQQDVVGEVTYISTGPRIPNKTVLRKHQERRYTTTSKEGEHFMKLEGQVRFASHRMQKAVKRINHDETGMFFVDSMAYLSNELPRAKLCSVDLLQNQLTASDLFFNLQAE